MDLNLKKSQYNIFVPHKDKVIVFNTLSGALGKFDMDFYKRYQMDSLNEEEIKTLLKKGILVSVDFDERKKIYLDRLNAIQRSDLKIFRIWTTSNCNAHCYYCFEKGIEVTTMNLEVARETINFIDKRVNNNDILRLEWFGGEPLLNTEVIDYISTEIRRICNKKKCKTENLLITNGSLITQEIVQKIKDDWSINNIQITLDGFEEHYNKTKNYNEPVKYNFYSVINSIKLLLDKGVRVSIRMNYDTSNYESLSDLIEFLHIKFQGYRNISYYIYPVWSSGDFNSEAEADEKFIQLLERLASYKMGDIRQIARLNYKKNACQSWNKNTFTILPDGKISKCCETFDVIIGDLYSGITNKAIFEFWINPNVESKCIHCIYLPICQGGCKASYFNKMPQCFLLKPIVNKFLKWYVDYLDANKK